MCDWMITTVTLNAAIDKTYYVSRFSVGESHRATKIFAQAGGKGINVARTLLQLGFKPMTTGFLGGHNGALAGYIKLEEVERIKACVEIEEIGYNGVNHLQNKRFSNEKNR
jgi:fructose-1-phosphate kinase PfkB-like protein